MCVYKSEFLTGKTHSETCTDINYETLQGNFCQNTEFTRHRRIFWCLKVWAGTQDTWTQFMALLQFHCAAIGKKCFVFFVPDFPLFSRSSNKKIVFLLQGNYDVYLDGKQLRGYKKRQARNTSGF